MPRDENYRNKLHPKMRGRIVNQQVVNFINRNILGRAQNVYSNNSSSGWDGYLSAAKEFGYALKQKDKFLHFYLGDTEIGHVVGQRSSLVSTEAARKCSNKIKILRTLEERGIQQGSIVFSTSSTNFDELARLWIEYGKPSDVVIKPAFGSGGKGISFNPKVMGDLRLAWEKLMLESTRAKRILVEKYFQGIDVRVIVVNGQSVCSVVRLPPHVIGNGRHSLDELIVIKNKMRATHPHHKRFPILHSLIRDNQNNRVLGDGEVLVMTHAANIHQGGEAIDYSDQTPTPAMLLAESAVQCIDGLGCSAVDLLIDEKLECKLLEINTAPNFGIHYYPLYGTPQNPARQVVLEMMRRASNK